MKQAVKDAKSYLADFDLQLDVRKVNINTKDELLYDVAYTWDWLVKTEQKTLKPAVIYTLGQSNEYDGYIFMCTKKDSLTSERVYGQYENYGGKHIIEVYTAPSRKKHWGLAFSSYNLVHEIMHAFEYETNTLNDLHKYIINNSNLDKYRDTLLGLYKKTITFHKATHKILGTWKLTQAFGVNELPIYKEMGLKGHNGLDFYSPVGWKMYFNVETPSNITWTCYNYEDKFGKKIVSISDEKVPLNDGLHYVGITHLHIQESKVKDGQKIKFGDFFAITGNTGLSTGPHTHESLKKVNKNGVALENNNGYKGAIDHINYYK